MSRHSSLVLQAPGTSAAGISSRAALLEHPGPRHAGYSYCAAGSCKSVGQDTQQGQELNSSSSTSSSSSSSLFDAQQGQ
jgi:hypothetical protein